MRSADYIMSIAAKKNQMNVVVLDKKRIKEGTFQSLGHLGANSGQANKTSEYKKFFEELVRTKSLHTGGEDAAAAGQEQEAPALLPLLLQAEGGELEYVHYFKVPAEGHLVPEDGPVRQRSHRRAHRHHPTAAAPAPGGPAEAGEGRWRGAWGAGGLEGACVALTRCSPNTSGT